MQGKVFACLVGFCLLFFFFNTELALTLSSHTKFGGKRNSIWKVPTKHYKAPNPVVSHKQSFPDKMVSSAKLSSPM